MGWLQSGMLEQRRGHDFVKGYVRNKNPQDRNGERALWFEFGLFFFFFRNN